MGIQISNDIPQDTKAIKKHYKSWTSGSQSDWKVVQRAYAVNKKQYIDCTVLEPADCSGDTIMLPISKPLAVLTQKQIAAGLSEDYAQAVTQTLLNLWCGVPVTARNNLDTIDNEDFEQGETDSDSGGSSLAPTMNNPFDDTERNKVWSVFTSQMIKGYEELADIDMLKPDPANRAAAMKNSEV
eukprot:3941021-Rhodomonas_salina.2